MTTTMSVPADLYFERVDQLRKEREAAREQARRYETAIYALACQLVLHGCAKDAAASLRHMAADTRVPSMADIYRLAAETIEVAEREVGLERVV